MGVRFGGSSDFSRLAGDWERAAAAAAADDGDGEDDSVGRRSVDESGVTEPEGFGRELEAVVSLSIPVVGQTLDLSFRFC